MLQRTKRKKLLQIIWSVKTKKVTDQTTEGYTLNLNIS